MKTLFARNAMILLAFLCLSFNSHAQYTKILRGQSTGYDTAVAIQIQEYRAIRMKVIYADSLIRGLNLELSKSRTTISNLEIVKINYELQIASSDRSHKDDRQTIADLNRHFDSLVKLIPGKKTWYRSDTALICYGAAMLAASIKLTQSLRK